MLYAILKPIVTVALRLYFRRVKRNGLEHIDNGQPTLILANHTASFMDAILVACFVRRRVHFFARGDVFGKKWADKVLRSIGLMPVYRLRDGRDKLQLNDTSNEEATEILRQGGAVLIFCEGVSDTAKRLKALKKGPFRLAANAAASLRVAPLIVPLGINYVTPTKPGGDVFLEAGAPMATINFLDGKDEASLAKAATTMMRQTEAALSTLVWHTHHEQDEPLANLLLYQLQESMQVYSFKNTQQIIHRINTAPSKDLLPLTTTIERPVEKSRGITSSTKRIAAGEILALLILSPIAVVGYLFHIPAIWLASLITGKVVKAPDFIAPVFLSCALLLMIIWYLLWLAIAVAIYPTVIWIVMALIVSISGLLYLKLYWSVLRRITGSKMGANNSKLDRFIETAISQQ